MVVGQNHQAASNVICILVTVNVYQIIQGTSVRAVCLVSTVTHNVNSVSVVLKVLIHQAVIPGDNVNVMISLVSVTVRYVSLFSYISGYYMF